MRPYAPANRCTKVFAGHVHTFEKNLLRCDWNPDGSKVRTTAHRLPLFSLGGAGGGGGTKVQRKGKSEEMSCRSARSDCACACCAPRPAPSPLPIPPAPPLAAAGHCRQRRPLRVHLELAHPQPHVQAARPQRQRQRVRVPPQGAHHRLGLVRQDPLPGGAGGVSAARRSARCPSRASVAGDATRPARPADVTVNTSTQGRAVFHPKEPAIARLSPTRPSIHLSILRRSWQCEGPLPGRRVGAVRHLLRACCEQPTQPT